MVRDMFRRALAGESLRAIAASLEARGSPTPYERGHWCAATVRRILPRETYSTGDRVAYATRFERQDNGKYRERPGRDDERVVIPGLAPPLVTPEDQAAIASRLAMNQRTAARNNHNPELALLRSGYARCGHCGWALRVSTTGARAPRYACSYQRKGACPGPVIAVHLLDGPVWEAVADLLRNPRVIAEELGKHREDGGLEQELVAVERLLTDITTKQRNLATVAAAIADEAAAAPLAAELTSLAARKKAAKGERAPRWSAASQTRMPTPRSCARSKNGAPWSAQIWTI